MRLEIERKFLVRDGAWRELATSRSRLLQGYLANTPACSIRVRRSEDRGWISIKGMEPGRARPEYEYAIPTRDVDELLTAFVGPVRVEKVRHLVPVADLRFEIDEFEGSNRGLVLAEIELPAVDAPFPMPGWLGDEVTDDARFYNFRLASTPFSVWDDTAQNAVRAGRRPPGNPA